MFGISLIKATDKCIHFYAIELHFNSKKCFVFNNNFCTPWLTFSFFFSFLHVHTWNPPGNPIALFISHKTKESGINLFSIEIEPYVWGLFSLWFKSKVSFDRFFKNTRKKHLRPSHHLSLFYWLRAKYTHPLPSRARLF